MMASRVERYCCGCGLCSGVCDHHIDARGYYRPTSDPEESGFDTSVCYCNSLTGAGTPPLPGARSSPRATAGLLILMCVTPPLPVVRSRRFALTSSGTGWWTGSSKFPPTPKTP